MSLYVYRPFTLNAANLKVVNEEGVELSVAFDDSAGKMHHLGRVSMARFKGNKMLGEESPVYSDEDFLKALAEHLGYEVTKKTEAPACDHTYASRGAGGVWKCIECHKVVETEAP